MYYAHSIEGKEKEGNWQELDVHLEETGDISGKNAAKFNQKDLGEALGRLHDIGKYSQAFQDRLDGGVKVDHSTAGANEAVNLFENLGKEVLAYCLAGHHGGLPDTCNLEERFNKDIEDYSAYKSEKFNYDIKWDISNHETSFSKSFLTRMLFSCLVDADWLNTEEFYKGKERTPQEKLINLYDKLQKKLDDFKSPKTTINIKREEILQACKQKAPGEQGLYSLTVPTGGGKTISSMAFAMEHAEKHGLDRVIYAIPYTSIIEQNAQVFRDIFGTENVLEHHSNYIFEEKETDEKEYLTAERMKQASENWDSPIIATTNVQFFESLFANKPSKCRKLHNISKSVIILDEAQMIPTEYLIPCVNAIGELVKNYNCTVVLCTATQPALDDKFKTIGLGVEEIIPDREELFKYFERVDIKNIGRKTDDELVEEISDLKQVLVIVNTKKHALELYKKLEGEGVYHLSTLMCPAHRKEVIAEIKGRLKDGLPIKVVSTQLIEAGVDIDFPVVYRSIAGADSIAQAAGRCNREGRIDKGIVRVFESAEKHGMPRGSLKQPAQVGRGIFEDFPDISSIEAIEQYFKTLFFYAGEKQLDAKSIMEKFKKKKRGGYSFSFKEAAKNFKFIRNNTKSVIVPHEEDSLKIMDKLKHAEFPKKYLRQLQPYTVNLYEQDYRELLGKGSIEEFKDITAILLNPGKNYDENTGIIINKESEALFDV